MSNLKQNKLKAALKRGETCIGSMIVGVRSPQIVQMFASAGWDFLCIDMEHGQFDMQTIADMMTIARFEEITPLVRVPDALYHLLARPLDNGAMGLVIPRVETREQVQRIIQSTKYWPEGSRGASLSGIHTAFRGAEHVEYMRWANAETIIVIQIESKRAVDNLPELVSVEGVDATWVGPFDLSQSLGIPGQFKHPEMIKCYERVIEVCNQHGVAPGIHFQDTEWLQHWMERGFRLAMLKSDVRLLMDAARDAVSRLRRTLDHA